MTSDPGRISLWEGMLSSLAPGAPTSDDVPLSEQLLKAIQGHIAAEEASLGRYRDIQQESTDPVVRLLISELLADEEHHHHMLERMEAVLGRELGGPSSADALPSARLPAHAADPSVIAEVGDLADHEHRGSSHMSELAKQSSTVHAGFVSLLLESMAMDSRKHEMILRFIAKRMQGE